MSRSDTLWNVFQTTGYIGAYLLYLHIQEQQEVVEDVAVAFSARGVAGIL